MTRDRHPAPCEAWAPLLAANARDRSAVDQIALDRHVASCAACAATRTDYATMDGLLRGLAAPDPLPGLPPRLLAAWHDTNAGRFAGFTRFARLRAWGRRSGTLEEMVLDETLVNGHESEGMRLMQTTSADPTPVARHTPPRRRLAGWLGGTAAVAVVLLFALAFALLSHGGAGPGAGHKTGQGTGLPRATATMLPVGPRQAAYLAQDGHLHYVSLDGAHDTTGPALPGITWISQAFNDGGARTAVAPDGSAIAYAGGDDVLGTNSVVIVRIASGAVTRVTLPTTGGQSQVRAANLFWSPDGRQVAVDPYTSGSMGLISLVDVAAGTARQLGGAQVYRIVGWLDATHLAVLADRGAIAAAAPPDSGQVLAMPMSGGPLMAVDALDTGSGALRHIVDVDGPPDVFVTPDGKLIYVAPSTWVDVGYVVDSATGKTRDLPHISRVFAPHFVNIDNDGFAKGGNWAVPMAWLPGTHTVAMSLGAWGQGPEGGPAIGQQPAGVWLLDLDDDMPTSMTTNSYPIAWMPDGGTLLVSSVPETPHAGGPIVGGLNVGPVLSALAPVAPGGQTRVLARKMVLFFGLVRVG